MNRHVRIRTNRVAQGLVLLLLLSTQLLGAAPGVRSQTKQEAFGPGSVAIAPFVFVGRVDEVLTNSFLKRLASANTGSRIVDDATFAAQLGKGVRFRSDAPLPALLKAARAAKAEVLIVGQASSYRFLEAPGVKLSVRVIAVNSGNVLNRSVAEETSWTIPGAKSEAGSTAAKQIVKQWRAE